MQNLTSLLKQHSIKFYVITSTLTIAISILIYLFLSYGFVQIKVSSKQNSIAKVTIQNNDNGSTQVFSVGNSEQKIKFVKKGEYLIFAEQRNNETFTSSRIDGFFKSHKIVLEIKPEVDVSRIGSESLGCGFVLDNLYHSYKCYGSTNIFKHTPLTESAFSEKGVFPNQSAYDSIIYLHNKIITLNILDDGAYVLRSILPNGQILKGHMKNTIGAVSLIKNDSDQPNSIHKFGVVEYDLQKISIYKDFNDGNPITITLKNMPELKNLSMLSSQLFKDELVVYFHPPLKEGDQKTEGKANNNINEDGIIVRYSLRDQKIKQKIKVKNNYQVSTISYLGNDMFIGNLSGGGSAILEQVGKNLVIQPNISNANRYALIENGLIIEAESAIYRFNTKSRQFQRLFMSEHLNISGIENQSGRILFTAYTKDSPQEELPAVYELHFSKEAKYPRLEYFLPYDNPENINRMEYNDTIIRISPALTSYSSDKISGNLSYDPNEFNQITQKISEQLRKDGISDKRKIIFGN